MFDNEDEKCFREIKYLMSCYPMSITVNNKSCSWMNHQWYVFVKDSPEKEKSFKDFHEAMQYLASP